MRLLLGEAHRKLIKECSLPTPNLRQLVGHANLVDVLVISIQYTTVQRDDELSPHRLARRGAAAGARRCAAAGCTARGCAAGAAAARG